MKHPHDRVSVGGNNYVVLSYGNGDLFLPNFTRDDADKMTGALNYCQAFMALCRNYDSQKETV
jgi:hypothetical protein